MGARSGPASRRGPLLARRALLRGAAAAGVGIPLLAACDQQSSSTRALEIPSPDNPVTWPLSEANPAIESGLTPERGSTLRIYNYADYLSPRMMKDFEAEHGVNIQLTTFNDADEALTKIASKKLGFDLYFPSYDSLGKLVGADLLRPLNGDYLTNRPNLWRSFDDPWYDQGNRYTIPYTIYSVGIGWRTDMVSEDIPARDNPYDVFWDTQYAGNMAILDDWHTAMAMVMLRNGIEDINTTDPDDMELVRTQLLEIRDTMKPRVTISMYTELPAGQYGLSQMWSGDAINLPYYLPKSDSTDILRYWFPPDGKGEVDNDLCVCLAQGDNPVAAHFFMNALLDKTEAGKNFGFTGYQPPLKQFTPDNLVAQGYLPQNLSTAIVKESDFEVGFPLLQVPAEADAEYHRIWQEFKAGG
ncbi:polyamine ABC transporter substrate-binding protein [Nocardioides sp. GXQ0305]|uniref:polyamine ABC transporter substrate-binding protein n=1 Tax=Nocardioides sp. GXQ0305 TaxID=3423912 RepID=UPI003D7D7781